MAKKAYSNTKVSVSKSREDIEYILRKWEVTGVSWFDDYQEGITILRFKWERDDRVFVAKFPLQVESDEKLEGLAIDGRNGQFSEKKFERLQKERGKREHRLLYMFLKNTFEAVNDGIIRAENVFLPWLEDAKGFTVAERLGPIMGRLTEESLPKMLGAPDDSL